MFIKRLALAALLFLTATLYGCGGPYYGGYGYGYYDNGPFYDDGFVFRGEHYRHHKDGGRDDFRGDGHEGRGGGFHGGDRDGGGHGGGHGFGGGHGDH